MSDWVTVIDSVHFRRNIVFQPWNAVYFPKNGLFRVKSALLCLSPPITGFVITQNSQGVSDWFTEVSIYARQILALWSQPMPSQQSLMDGSVSQSQGRLQCLIVCIICEACLQNTPDRCVCALGFYALRSHRHTHNGVAALHGVFISEQILSKSLNLSLSIMDHRLEKSFCVVWSCFGGRGENQRRREQQRPVQMHGKQG